ncbi:MAG: BON domain-containing protein [Burkholderiales bacterium]|nr:BON domain-containing protein [Burkholderiales bacterium]
MTLGAARATIAGTALAAALAATTTLTGCAPLVVGGAMVGGVLVATDRRTTGAQLEDQGIEIKAAARVRELATLGHVNVTSYNRLVLLTGEVPDADARARIEAAVAKVENVRSVVDELAIAGASSMTSRSNDALLTTKVKASLVDARDLYANAFKVVTERATVYLMGRVTEREGTRAAEVARTVPGVQKVVRVFETLSDDELRALQIEPAPAR